MNLRWLWFDHIPPGLEVPKEARGIVRRRAAKLYDTDRNRFGARWRGFALLFGAMGVYGIFVCVVVFADMIRPSNWPTFGMIVLSAGGFWVHSYYRQPFTRLALCHLGYFCCVKCGYVHTGLSKDVKECPECGAAREFGKCIHCNATQAWAMTPQDKCTQCGRLRLS